MNRKEITILAVIIFFTVITWVIFGIAHAKNTTTITQKDLRQVVPLTPSFDNDIIKKMKSREE